MFVTSDVFDLRQDGQKRRFDWRENLLCGIGLHGAAWRNIRDGATFLVEAARRRGLMDEMRWASYSRPGDSRSRPIKPGSFPKLQQGGLAGAREADSLLLRGERSAPGTRLGDVIFGGVVHAGELSAGTITRPHAIPQQPFRSFDADFLFHLTDRPIDDTCELLRLAVQVLGAEYGYGFLRDDLCFPAAYCQGVGWISSEFTETNRRESEEIGGWRQFVTEEQLWTGPWPLLRDLFQVNLISERHTSVRIEGLGYLLDWIAADPGRGRLEDVGEGRWLWVLPDKELFDTRPLLYEAGLLFSYQKRVYRDLGLETEARPPKRLGSERPRR